MNKPVKYRPLLRLYPLFALTRERLWLADDHVLVTHSLGFGERYSRIYFATLQAARVRRTARRMIWNIIWFSLALLLGLPLWFLAKDPAFPLATTGFFMLAALLNTLMGRSCKLSFITPAGEHNISCVKRVGRARKLLKLIRPRVMRLQMSIADEPIKQGTPGSAAGPGDGGVHVR